MSSELGEYLDSGPGRHRDLDSEMSQSFEGRLSFHDYNNEYMSSPEEGQAFLEGTNNQTRHFEDWGMENELYDDFEGALDSLINEASDLWNTDTDPVHEDPLAAIEFGVTPKSLNRDPPYHPKVLELFRNKPNVWLHGIKRVPAWTLWTEKGLRKNATKADAGAGKLPSISAALSEHMDLDSAAHREVSSEIHQGETGQTEVQHQVSVPSKGQQEDEHTVMTDPTSNENPANVLPRLISAQDGSDSDVMFLGENTIVPMESEGDADVSDNASVSSQDSISSSTKERLRELEAEVENLGAFPAANGETSQ